MAFVLWDASALAKRYTEEVGDDVVDAVFAAVSISQMALTPLGYAETYSIVLRRRNDDTLSRATFAAVTAKLNADVLGSPGLNLLTISDALIFGCLSLMQAHNLNASDAAILATYLRYSQVSGDICLLLAADKRLLRAASAEGLPVLNPETLPAADAPAFLAAL